MKSVYLAGPISGLSYDGANEWRAGMIEELQRVGIAGYSPLRAKEYLRNLKEPISATGEEYAELGAMSLPKGVIARDRFDATRCDVLFVNFLGAKTPSLGTVMEIAWADAHRIPIVCAMEKGNVHEHMMINEAIGFRVTTLSEALHIIKAILV